MNKCYVLSIDFENNGHWQTINPVLLKDVDNLILIDCGYPNFIPLLADAADSLGISLHAVTKVIVTHHDIDHIGSLAELKRNLPHIKIIAHEIEKPYIDGTRKSLRLQQAESTLDILPEEAKADAAQFIRFLKSVETVSVDQTVAHQEVLPWCGGIEIIHTPGHMPGHISLYLPWSKTLIAADALVIEEGKLELANPRYTLDQDAAVQSVRLLLNYEADQLICYHGGVFEGEVKKGIQELLAKYETDNR